jgi:hypothetical protein
MLIYNPDEKFTWHGHEVVNDGGQQFPNGASEPMNMQEFLLKDYKTGRVLAQGFGSDSVKPEYTYLKGELAEAYSDKVKSFQRSFVFLNLNNPEVPAALVVFDRVVAPNRDFKKTWLLHCVEEPEIEGIVTIVRRSEKGYNGKMVNTTLLPLTGNLTIQKVGGKGNEYNVNGINYPQYVKNKSNSADGAIWRLEVSPKKPSSTDLFLNVMQVMDNSGQKNVALQTDRMVTDEFVGTKIGDRIALFCKYGVIIDQSFKIQIDSDTPVKVLISDVKEGIWKISRTEKDNSTFVQVKIVINKSIL